MTTTPLMECGHAANAQDKDGNPVCVICVGIVPGATVVADAPSLNGRTAHCTYYGKVANGRNHEGDFCKRGEQCLCEKPSSTGLAFFEHLPDKEHDSYYCGCWGWE